MRKRVMGIAAVLAAAAAVGASPAAAASIDCGRAGGMVNGTLNGSVYVGPGVTCVIAGAHVTGMVSVQPRGALILFNAQVDRTIQATAARWLWFSGTNTVQGNVLITGTTSMPPGFTANPICTTTIGGTLALTGNTAPFKIGCGPGAGNTIRSVLIGGNPGEVTFQYNTVLRTAICQGGPVTGTGNTAAKKIGCP
jgi:hypothetical protein